MNKEETLKNIEYWESEVNKALAENNINKAIACRILANKLREDIEMKELTGKKVKTIDGHSGIVIKHFKPTGRNMTVHIKQDDGRVWYCPDKDVIEVED